MTLSPRRSLAAASVAVASLALLAACGGSSADDSGPTDASSPRGGEPSLVVAAGFFPLAELVEAVGGAQVRVLELTPPGREAHEHELSAGQLTDLSDADAVVYLGDGFQPAIEDAIATLPDSVRLIDLLDGLTLLAADDDQGDEPAGGHEHEDGGHDPHVWLDPTNMATMAIRLGIALAEADPAHADSYHAQAAAYADTIGQLDADFAESLATCRSRVIVTGHRAFAYLAHRYGLTQVAIAGISPEEEPSAKTLESIAETAREAGVTTIFFEQSLPDDLSRTVADEIGAETAVLDSAESPSGDQLDAGATYLSIMRDDLAALVAALGCDATG